jgi:predicted RND superfamily exporter protein
MTPFGIAAPSLVAGNSLSREQMDAIGANDLVIGTLLSSDLHTAGILVNPTDTALAPHTLEAWTAALRELVQRHATQGRHTYIAGTPIERHDVASYLQRDQQLTVPIVFMILLGITYGLYRQLRLALIPLACVLLSLNWTLAVVGFSGIQLNLITSLLSPVIMVVSVSAAIHLINAFLTAQAADMPPTEAVTHALQQVGMACWLTAFTTMLGFFSLLVSPVPAVREFAAFAGIGVGLSAVITITVVPLALLQYGHVPLPPQRYPVMHAIERTLIHCFHWMVAHRLTICCVTLVILAVSLAGIPHLTEGTDIVRALKRTAPLRLSTEFIDHHLTGVNSLEIILTLPETGANPAFIRQTLAFSTWLRHQPGVTTVHSPWEVFRSLPAEYLANDEQLRVLAALLPLSLPLEHWLSADANALRISARVNAMASDRLLKLARDITRHAEQTDLDVKLTGANYLLALMSRTLVLTQIRSLLIAIILILSCIALTLRSGKLGLIAAIPNLVPLLILFGLMGWGGVMLSTATTMIASVALGLIVDDTIHLLYGYRRATQTGLTSPQALQHAIRHTGPALVITTLILTLGFWAGLVGSFKPTVSFAFLTGLTMLTALLADLLVLPAILLIRNPKGPHHRGAPNQAP